MTYTNTGIDAYNAALETQQHSQMIVTLFHMTAVYVSHAREAEQDRRPLDRHTYLNKALGIIHGLHLGLDREASPKAADALAEFYQGMDMQLIALQAKPETWRFDEVLKMLHMMCDSWQNVAYETMGGSVDNREDSHNDIV